MSMLVLLELDQVLTRSPKPVKAMASTEPRIDPRIKACQTTSLPWDTTKRAGTRSGTRRATV